MKMACSTVALAASVLTMAAGDRAEAKPGLHAIVIGANTHAAEHDGDATVSPLRYADDDASAMFRFLVDAGAEAELLTVLDVESQKLNPDLVARTLPPTLGQLRESVARVKAAIDKERRAGLPTTLIFYFGGHGVVQSDGNAALLLRDGGITRQLLHDEILAGLESTRVHLLVDACHAEAVVRPRGARATTTPITAEDMADYVTESTLARFPNVGAIVASTATSETHEWEAVHGGVFTYELLSGLRGAADVNGDLRVAYSEIFAFLVAANEEIADASMRPTIVARAPDLDKHADLMDVEPLTRSSVRIRGLPRGASRYYVEADTGRRIADVNAEEGARPYLLIPAGSPFFIHANAREWMVDSPAGSTVLVATLAAKTERSRARGGAEEALRRGIFAVGYGPSFYRGVMARTKEFVAVAIVNSPDGVVSTSDGDVSPSLPHDRESATRRLGAPLLVGAGAVVAAAGVTFGVLALKAGSDYESTNVERIASDARERFTAFRTAAIVSLAVGVAAAGAGTYLWKRHVGPESSFDVSLGDRDVSATWNARW
jgi:hypothetical protein